MMRQSGTKIYLNTCDLFIEEVQIDIAGYFYIVWKKGKKTTQTLKYYSDINKVIIQQNLTLNLSLEVKNGRTIEKNTSLFIMNAEGAQISRAILPVHKWVNRYDKINLQFGNTRIVAKAKRKSLMEIEGLSYSEQQSVGEERTQDIHIDKILMKSSQQIGIFKDEMNKIRQQLEDTSIYNNKLKNDRAVLISKNVQLQNELSKLKAGIKDQFAHFQRQYQTKIQNRQIIYEDQINNMVSTFNSHNEYNLLIIKNINKEKIQKQQEATFYKHQYDNLSQQLEDYESRLTQIEEEKNNLKESLSKQHQDLQALHIEYKKSVQTITMLQEQKVNIEKSLEEYREMMKKVQNEKESLLKQLMTKDLQLQNIIKQKDKFCSKIQQLKEECDMYRNELEFTEGAMKEQHEAHERTVQGYQQHVRALQTKLKQMEGQLKESDMFKQQATQNQTKFWNIESEYQQLLKQYDQRKQYISDLEDKNDNIEMRMRELLKELQLKNRTVLQMEESMKLSQIQLQEAQKRNKLLPSKQQVTNQIQQNINHTYKQKQIKNEHAECQQLISTLKQKNRQLEEELVFMTENTIKKQEHQALLERLKQLETIIDQNNQIGIHTPADENNDQEKNEREDAQNNPQIGQPSSNYLIEEAEQIDLDNLIEAYDGNQNKFNGELNLSEKQELEMLREKCRKLEQKQSLLLLELAQKQKSELEPLDIQEIQYCSSQQAEGREVEYAQPQSHQGQQKVCLGSEKRLIQFTRKLKKSSTLQPQQGTFSYGNQIKSQEMITVNVGDNNQQKIKSQAIIEDQRIRADGIEQMKCCSFMDGQNSPFVRQQQHINRDFSSKLRSESSRSKNTNKLMRSDSRQSYLSKNTYYKYKKVSHRDKIKGLELELKEFQEKQNSWKELQAIYKSENKTYFQQIQTLKQNLANISIRLSEIPSPAQTLSKHTQTYIETLSKSTQSDLIDPQKTKLQQLLNHRNHEYEVSIRQFERKQKEDTIALRYMKEKNEQLQKYSEGVLKVSEQQQQQINRLKGQVQDADRNKKQIIQDSKLRVSKIQFELGNSQSQVKRFKSRIEELEDKVRKNDVMDLYKQAQFEVESMNKKNIQMNRALYQTKLEKDGLEEQLKTLKKKISDLNRMITEHELFNERLEKGAEEHKKKSLRLQRQVEDKQNSLKQQLQLAKRLNQQISSLKSSQTHFLFDKKKMNEEQNSLQHQIERKQYEINNLKKEVDRLKRMLNEKEEEKTEKRKMLSRQIQRFETETSSKDKEIYNLESTISNLKYYLQTQQSEAKRNIEEKSHVYSQKLRNYVEEIQYIRNMLEQNNQEIIQLKRELQEANQQLEIKMEREKKLELQYARQMQTHQETLQTMQKIKSQNQTMKQLAYQTQYELQNIRNSIKLMKTDLQRQKREASLKTEQVEELTKNNEVNTNLINKYKVKLADYEASSQINYHMSEKLNEEKKLNEKLTKELRELSNQYDEYRTKFIHSNQHLANAVGKMESKWKEKLQLRISELQGQFQKNRNTEKKKYEGQLVDLLNQNARLKNQLYKKQQEITRINQKLCSLEILSYKLSEIETLYKTKQNQCNKYRQIASSNPQLSQKLTKLQDACKGFSQQNESLLKQLVTLNSKVDSAEKTVKALKLEVQQRDQTIKLKNQCLDQKQGIENTLKWEVERLLGLVQKSEKDKEIMLQKIEDNKANYTNKIQHLQQKLNVMGMSVEQHERTLESHYTANLSQFTEKIQTLNHQLQKKNKIIASLQQMANQAQSNKDDLKKVITKMKAKQTTENELFEAQIQKLNKKIIEMEKLYLSNTGTLEAEIEQKNRKLALLNDSVKQPRLSNSGIDDKGLNYRLEEKVRMKNLKIEELERNLEMSQEAIIKLKKSLRQISQSALQVSKLEKIIKDLQHKNDQSSKEFDSFKNKQQHLMTGLKQQLNKLRQQSEKYKSLYQQKELQKDSISYQLKTTKEIYAELQNQLNKRKIVFRGNTKEQSKLNEIVHEKNHEIQELKNQRDQYYNKNQQNLEEIAKKNQNIYSLENKLMQLEKSSSKLKVALSTRTNEEGRHYKQEIIRKTEENEQLTAQIKRLKHQNQQLHKDNSQMKTQLSFSQGSLDNMNYTLEELSAKCQQYLAISKKHESINEKCMNDLMMSLEEAFLHEGINQLLKQKQFELKNMGEQVEELKFLNERKYMDYNELKKANYQLEMQLEETEVLAEQVEELRVICDNLEKQKKQAIFREEFMLLQIENIIKNSSGKVRLHMIELINATKRALI